MSDSARIPKATGVQARIAVWAATRQFGPEAADMVAIYARHPKLMHWFALYDRAVSKRRRVPERLRVLAELTAATTVGCAFCIDMGSSIARRSGLSDEQLLRLHEAEDAPALFDADERLVAGYARAMSRTPPDVTDAQVAALRERFGDAGLLELTHLIAWENVRSRFNSALDIRPGGFSTGQVCARAATPAATPAATTAV